MTVEQAYAYAAPSVLDRVDDGARLALATSGGATIDGASAHPQCLRAVAGHPDVVAAGLLVVARVARTRYHVPPGTLARILREADPVVTVAADVVRFESFSACGSVAARLDVDVDALDVEHLVPGATNVDVNPPLRTALAGVRADEPLRIEVGDDGVRVRTRDDDVVEERVPLPDRWLRGFGEAQAASSAMRPTLRLDAPAARRFVRGLPKGERAVTWATATPRGVRLATVPTAGATCLAGPERLRTLEPLLGAALALEAHGAPVDATSGPQASAWVLSLPGARLTLTLSAEQHRGFSGEGSLLHAVAGATADDDADLVAALLAYDATIDVARLAADAALPRDRVDAALAVLASSGVVGFDVHRSAYFHRPLPLVPDVLAAMHPRLVAARALVADGGVAVGDDGVVRVTSGGQPYQVRLGTPDRCTCPWFARHRNARGPCKHVLAVRMVVEARP
ncbi:SWIM zinc finger family protein [Agrococcus jejuensis]|uniref:SWIM zinc finger n=1 Tax=Agrococcus jejuensis TaxID=399736 RepID=A0A1G8AF30_9MICO|nr:SWIM zinc finger family protein [Agrococcus jejuensis]SDH19548.1 SWIM zinc finger [Agrococcus jejuensis]